MRDSLFGRHFAFLENKESQLIAVVAAFIVGGLIIVLIGDNPFQTFSLMVSSSFGSLDEIGYMFVYATRLIFTGFAVAVVFYQL